MMDLLKQTKIPQNVLIKRTWKYVKKERLAFIISFFFILLNVFLGVITPRITGLFTDYITGPIENINLRTIILIALSVLFASVLSQTFLFIESMILTKAGQRIVYSLRMEVFAHIESMSQNQFNDMAVGSLVTRVCNYTSQLSEFFTDTLVRIIRDSLTVVVVYIWMLILSPYLGLILASIVGLIFIISYFFSKDVHKTFHKERAQISDLNSFLNETRL